MRQEDNIPMILSPRNKSALSVSAVCESLAASVNMPFTVIAFSIFGVIR